MGYELECASVDKHLPAPPVRVGRLDTLARLRLEMRRVYQLARAGRIEVRDLPRFIYALREMADLIRTVELEERLAALEGAVAARPGNRT